jgi:putative aldouronate transport system permease protein
MVKNRINIKRYISNNTFDFILYILLAIFLIIIIYPLLYVVAASFTDPLNVYVGKISIIIKEFSIKAYSRILQNESILIGYRNTILYAILSIALTLAVNFAAAYPMSIKNLLFKKFLTIFFCVPLYISGGLIPSYLLIRAIGLYDTFWAIILPSCFSFWNVVLIRTFIKTAVPTELQEAAEIDGAGYFKIFFNIVLPLCIPVIAIISLFTLVGCWNSYYSALVYISSESKYPLQLVLRTILLEQDISNLTNSSGGVMESQFEQATLREALKYSCIVVSTVPLLILYPFFSRYFEKGMLVGSLKG